MNRWLGAFLLIAATVASAVPAAKWNDHSLFQTTAQWLTGSGDRLALAGLAGHPVVLTMFYGSCDTICPMTTTELQLLEKSLPDDVRRGVRFVLVSLDPARDAPRRLQEFAAKHRLDAARWTLLSGSADDVQELAALLDVTYRADGKGGIAHGGGVFVLDKGGVVRLKAVDARSGREALGEVLTRLSRAP